jgi:7-cyano-7-deazaguanine synthase in queuosine biosynthesis
VIDWVFDYYGVKYEVIDMECNPEDKVEIIAPIRNIINTNQADVLFFGVNTYPDELKDDDFKNTSAAKQTTKENTPSYAYKPFIDIYKSHIIRLFYDNGIEELLDLTNSCTRSGETPCNECFPCKEKAWGLKNYNV